MLSEKEVRKETRLRAEAKLGFYSHLAVYSGINVMLFFIWWFTGGFPWFVFPLLGWGIGLLAHFLQVFVQANVIDTLAEKEYQKFKEKQQYGVV